MHSFEECVLPPRNAMATDMSIYCVIGRCGTFRESDGGTIDFEVEFPFPDILPNLVVCYMEHILCFLPTHGNTY